MAFRRATYEADVKTLIETLSGFKEEDENQDICINFVLSNLNYHRFLDPDSHKIKRAINGLSDKFRVHSQLEKASVLQELVAEFLGSVDNDSPTEVDCCYAMLSLLLLLSDHPTLFDYVEAPRRVPSPEEEIDWAAILMEGIEIQRVFPQSPEWSDLEDEDEEPEAPVAAEQQQQQQQQQQQNDDAAVARRPGEDVDDGFHEEDTLVAGDSGLSSQRSSRLPFASDENGVAWLDQNVVEPYWRRPLNSTEIGDESRSTQLSRQWLDYSVSSDVTVPPPCDLVLERYIVREIIWMLCGVEKLHLFTLEGAVFKPRPDISVSHLTQVTLLSYLEEVCRYGTIVRQFHRFCTRITRPTGGADVNDDVRTGVDDVRASVNVCRTYLAFATALHRFLAELKSELCRLERICIEKGLLLSGLYQSLKPRFSQLSLLNQLHEKALLVDGQEGRHLGNAERAEELLRTMNEMLRTLDGYGELRADGLALLLPMYVETIRPSLDMMDQLITVGRVDDYTHEFVITRDENVGVEDEHFWSDAYTLTTTTPAAAAAKLTTRERILPAKSGEVESSAYAASDAIRQSDKSSSSSSSSSSAPLFAVVLEDLILTAKSMEILHNLGRLSDVYRTDYRTLHSSIVAELTTSETRILDDPARGTRTSLECRNEEDRLLLANFQRLMSLSHVMQEGEDKKEMKSYSLGSWPLQRRLDEVLVDRVSARCQHVSSTLFKILLDEYDVMAHLHNVRKYFLMEAGDVMHDFYTDIFDKLRNEEEWCDVSYLTVLLQDCLSQHHQQQCKLFVHVDQSQSVRRQPINALDGLSLVYDVSWPVSVVIGRRCQAVYNSIFTWVLQVKRAKYCLDGLHYREFCARPVTGEVTSPEDSALYHRVQLFRMKLMNFVNALHAYIMAGALHVKSHQFTTSLTRTTDLAELLDLHTSFLAQIHAESLLTKNVILLKEAASKILNLCLVFQARMENEGLTRLNMSDLVAMDTELTRCLQFVASFLHNLTKHSAAPYLECLAVSVTETLNS